MPEHIGQLLVLKRIQPVDVVHHAIAENLALHLISGDEGVGVVDLHAGIFARKAECGFRV